ncbi:30S ribosomal protein S11 [Patescibacteria group bacterium]|nr:30S ribosomal protein S11 [Patescibacteria group bacterium]MBU1682589.1 30S ribosomal protein S11 [Patescibacteria group bacterium]MBU1935300.1 30S ribosomal protein S11 [Patescibacteria group bacterium]
MPPKAKKTSGSKKVKRNVPEANVYVIASYNNTLMTLTEPNGNVIAQASAGSCGFKGSRKSTPYAATVTAEKLMAKGAAYDVKKVKIFIKGVGTGREQAVRGLQAAGLELDAIFDITPAPHNGCRKKKRRRV